MEADNIILVIIFTIAILLFMAVSLFVFFYFARKKIITTEREKANLVVQHQKNLLYETIATQEEERKRIAQDLHDDISSKLNIVSLNANLLLEDGLDSEERKTLATSILEISSTTLENSRRIAHDLLPPTLDKFGLDAAIQELADEYNQSRKVKVVYNSSYKDKMLLPEQELHIFRIIQEAINNSIRHGKAEKVNIVLETDPFRLIYTDNGKGFDMEKVKEKKGLGLKNMESRAAMLNGNLKFESALNEGVNIEILF